MHVRCAWAANGCHYPSKPYRYERLYQEESLSRRGAALEAIGIARG